MFHTSWLGWLQVSSQTVVVIKLQWTSALLFNLSTSLPFIWVDALSHLTILITQKAVLFELLSVRNQIMKYNTCAMRASYIKPQFGIIIVTIQPDILIYSKSVLCLLTTQLKQLIFVDYLFPQKPTSSVLLLNSYVHYPQACLWIKMLQINGNINTSLSPASPSRELLKMPGSARSRQSL